MVETTIRVNTSTDPAAPQVAVDRIGTTSYQKVKLVFGPDGIATDAEDATPFPVDTNLEALVGALTETAPVTDIASSGFNGRLQRIAQRLTSLIALFPVALTTLGALKTGPTEGAADVGIPVGAAEPVAGIDTAGMRNFLISVPATFDGSSLTFKVATALAGTYQPLRDITGALVTLPVTAGCVSDTPGELTAARFIKPVANTNQLTTDTVLVFIYRS